MTKETDKISVIVPVYNVKNYLEDCVQSITHQTYPDLEILLIDDGSDDGSGEICDRLQMTDARIRVFHEKHKGVSGARNKGLKEAAGAYIAFVDSDDVLEPDMYSPVPAEIHLKYQLRILSQNTGFLYLELSR